VLIEHPAVAEAAVVPSPDPLRLSVPKAFIAVVAGHDPSPEVARSIFEHSQANLAGYKRIRRLEFSELPKTISERSAAWTCAPRRWSCVVNPGTRARTMSTGRRTSLTCVRHPRPDAVP